MTSLKNYHEFAGRHFETGPVRNALAYQGVKAPHTGQPISEALLLGVSGGVAVGYFLFEYEGYDPYVSLLTRNTFDPLETIFNRLVIPREVLQSTQPDTALNNVIDTIENGSVPLVWADSYTLPYNLLPYDEGMWGMVPVVVFGIEGDTVSIADRSSQPLTISVEDFMKTRERVKSDKYRVMVLDAPDMSKLESAVQKGIWQCISLYTDKPPRGKRENFGLAALEHWADMLTNTRNKHGWARYFPPGSRMYAALAGGPGHPGLFDWICSFHGAADGAERGLYADFLDEAAVILGKPDLKSVANQFRTAHDAWCALANAILPEDVPLFKETRDLKLRKNALFIEQGQAALDEMQAINTRLGELKATAGEHFPLNEGEAAAMCAHLRDLVLRIRDIEAEAIAALQVAMG